MFSQEIIDASKKLKSALNSKNWFYSVGLSKENEKQFLVVYVKSKITKTIEKAIPKTFETFSVTIKGGADVGI